MSKTSRFARNIITFSFATTLVACGGSNNSSDPIIENRAPSITGDNAPLVAENQKFVGTYSATDPDNDEIVFSLTGVDAALFTITDQGNLSFVVAPDYDQGNTGPYALTIVVTDSQGLASSISISVMVSNQIDPMQRALVQTIAADFVSGSEVMMVDGQALQVTGPYYVKNKTDYSIDTYQDTIYHIGSFNIDTIEKYHGNNPDTQIWSFSTQDPGDSTSRNPYTLVSVSSEKAYLIRYGSDKVWIVDPSVASTDPENFSIGQLDLSAYNLPGSVGGTPNPAAGLILNDKLYISMQRYSDDFQNIGKSYIAVFDIQTDEEIETHADDSDNLKGIPLTGYNPARNGITHHNDTLYVTTMKTFFSTDLSDSRIEAINTNDFSVSTVLDATDISGNSQATIKGTLVVNPQLGYFYTSQYDENFNEISSLYQFNPGSGEINQTSIADTGSEAISYATLDQANIIWLSVANPTNPGIDLIDSETQNKIAPRLSTELNPGVIRFLE